MTAPERKMPDRESGEKKRSKGSGALAAGTGLLLFLSKFKTVLFFLLKAGKPVWTMAISIGAYALIAPWTFAIGFVLLLFVHELGHVWAAKRRGVPVSAPIFIPFLGALILLKRNPKDAVTEAYIGIGGPVLGSAGAFVCYAIGWWTGGEIWYALAYAGFFLNLINLMPVHPLDGGRIVTAVSRWLWLVGVLLGPVIIWYFNGFIFLFIWLLFVWEMYKRFIRDRGKGEPFAVEGVYRAEADPGLPHWAFPGESHTRELPYTAYCRLDGEHMVEFSWNILAFRGEMSTPQGGLVHKVLLKDFTGPDPATGGFTFTVRVEGRHFQPDRYYNVPLRTRIQMGFMYGGLIGVLFYMIWKMSEAGLIPPA
jgi:Zn-dependent protease